MKHIEPDYLHTLFAAPSSVTDADEASFPLVDVPEGLGAKLKAIAESAPVDSTEVIKSETDKKTTKRGIVISWPAITSIAATLLVAIMGFQFYQQQQTLNRLEQAQADLATALHYLSEANRITRAQVIDSLNDSIPKDSINSKTETRIEPAIDNEANTLERETKLPNRSL